MCLFFTCDRAILSEERRKVRIIARPRSVVRRFSTWQRICYVKVKRTNESLRIERGRVCAIDRVLHLRMTAALCAFAVAINPLAVLISSPIVCCVLVPFPQRNRSGASNLYAGGSSGNVAILQSNPRLALELPHHCLVVIQGLCLVALDPMSTPIALSTIRPTRRSIPFA